MEHQDVSHHWSSQFNAELEAVRASVMVKTITDLERIGDEAEKIGYLASRLAAQERPADSYQGIQHLADLVATMLHRALDSFARMDPEEAMRVVRQDQGHRPGVRRGVAPGHYPDDGEPAQHPQGARHLVGCARP
jgi:Na+/phosphate symporter